MDTLEAQAREMLRPLENEGPDSATRRQAARQVSRDFAGWARRLVAESRRATFAEIAAVRRDFSATLVDEHARGIVTYFDAHFLRPNITVAQRAFMADYLAHHMRGLVAESRAGALREAKDAMVRAETWTEAYDAVLALAAESEPTSIRGLDPDFTGNLTGAEYVKRGWSSMPGGADPAGGETGNRNDREIPPADPGSTGAEAEPGAQTNV